MNEIAGGLETLGRIDFDSIAPDRLADVAFGRLRTLSTFESRGHEVDVDQLIGQLGAALDQAAVGAGEDSAPSNLRETEAVDVVADAFADLFPRWFDRGESLSGYEKPVSDEHLDVDALKEAYWAGKVNPATMPVAGGEWADQRRVVVSFLAVAWERVETQVAADREARVEAGESAIKQAILEEAMEKELRAVEVAAAYDAAIDALQSRRRS
jgi:hypothetical protein